MKKIVKEIETTVEIAKELVEKLSGKKDEKKPEIKSTDSHDHKMPKIIQECIAQYTSDVTFWPQDALEIYDRWKKTGESPDMTIDELLHKRVIG